MYRKSKTINRVASKLTLLTLLFTLILTLSAFNSFTNVEASVYSSELPGGVNYIEPANLEEYGAEGESGVRTIDPVLVKSNTVYTLTLDKGSIEDNYLIIALNGLLDEVGIADTFVSGTEWTYTFNTGSNNFIEIDIRSDYNFPTVQDNSTPGLVNMIQLEEGSSFTGWVAYEIPAVDSEPPLINGASAVLYSNVNNPYTTSSILATLTATDAVDGDVTASITTTTDELTGSNTVIGNYDLVITAQDTSGNIATVTMNVRVVDTTDPIINIIGGTTINLEVNTTYSEQGATVTDNYDTNKSATISGTVNNLVLGTYTITYSGTDSSGNIATSITRDVVVADTTSPIQTLNGDITVYIEYGSNFTEPGTVVTDNFDTGLTSSISGSVNVGVLGTYTLTYSVTDSNGNSAISLTRTIIVRDTTGATIGGTTNYVTYTDEASNLSALLVLTFNDIYNTFEQLTIEYLNDTYTGNEAIVGNYTVDVKVTDTSGNITQQSITIEVIDDVCPFLETTLTLYTIEYADSLSQEQIKALFGN